MAKDVAKVINWSFALDKFRHLQNQLDVIFAPPSPYTIGCKFQTRQYFDFFFQPSVSAYVWFANFWFARSIFAQPSPYTIVAFTHW